MQPFGDWRWRQGNPRTGSAGQRVHSTVGHIAMAIPTGMPLAALGLHIADTSRLHKLLVELLVAAYAVVLMTCALASLAVMA